ncbi:hypothetical protein WN990_10905 [Kitasatospora purpeofusca]|uniref:hypothetical protein n=1 Tax=Kitasatospora purpeofusca TaxID=67352 RepID=UPI0022560359|nr:hypothetical protein [Kitasatospora purpeofusca]MCX4758551.1 hypothetical protein [Kitasatospora purpeofusca]WSR31007.1 hypothetical protein OG715_08480 [Kitasatospora purpeofusca]WSR39041.1 hypothetical protein OG196_07985 [Kitasatospora purpeofusca]
MRVTDQRPTGADDAHDTTDREDLAVPHDGAPGVDPGEAELWETVRVDCPSCRRPIALVGDEERLPQHAVLPRAWHPFSPTLCPGSGTPTDDLAEVECAEEGDPAGLSALSALPGEHDWRTQPFSHAMVHRPVRSGSAPVIPEQRGRFSRR